MDRWAQAGDCLAHRAQERSVQSIACSPISVVLYWFRFSPNNSFYIMSPSTTAPHINGVGALATWLTRADSYDRVRLTRDHSEWRISVKYVFPRPFVLRFMTSVLRFTARHQSSPRSQTRSSLIRVPQLHSCPAPCQPLSRGNASASGHMRWAQGTKRQHAASSNPSPRPQIPPPSNRSSSLAYS